MVARLQGFPDDWQFVGRKTAAYRQVGNAVPVELSTAVAQSVRDTVRETVPDAVLDRLRHVKSEIETQILRDTDLALAMADDIADDSMISPSEVNRTIARMLKDNSHIRSIRFEPLSDPGRMAFTPTLSQNERMFVIDIPVPPMPWQAQKGWISLIVAINGAERCPLESLQCACMRLPLVEEGVADATSAILGQQH